MAVKCSDVMTVELMPEVFQRKQLITGKLREGRCTGEASGCLVLLNSKYYNSHTLEKVVQNPSNLTGARKQIALFFQYLPGGKVSVPVGKEKNLMAQSIFYRAVKKGEFRTEK